MSTLTVYPDAPGGDTIDGTLEMTDADSNWEDLRDGPGTNAESFVAGDFFGIFTKGGAANNYFRIKRSGYTYDTSDLTADAIISGAVASFHGTTKSDNTGWFVEGNIYSFTPADDDVLVPGDFTQLGLVAFCDTPITYADWDVADYNDFIMNATGLAAISKTGITRIGGRNPEYDVADSEPDHHSDVDNFSKLTVAHSAAAGTTTDAKLVITFTIPSGPGDLKSANGIALADIKSINEIVIADVKSVNSIA